MIDVMPTKLNNLNFFFFKNWHSSVSRPLRVGGILQCHVRVGAPSLFGVMATSDLALTLGGIIADNLSKAGGSWGCVSAVDSHGRTIFVADAYRDDGKRFVVHADEKLMAVMELESATRGCGEPA